MATKIFVNLPVKDLARSIVFFTRLGYTFNREMTDGKATCLVIGENIFVMLIVEKFFKNFTRKQICDSQKYTEAIIALSAESRAKVDEIIRKAVDAGAKTPIEPMDHGFMYQHGYQDLDGHLWEILYMDPEAVEAA